MDHDTRDELGFTVADPIDREAAAGQQRPTGHPAVDRAARFAHQTVDKAADAAVPAADWLEEKTVDARVRQKEWAEKTRVYVSANPLTGIGIAAAAGLLIGLIL